jgi:hypothetical protein
MSSEPKPTTILFFTGVLYVLAIFAFFQAGSGGQALAFSADGIQNVGRTLAPLFAIAAFIERAVEIAIASARNPGATDLRLKLQGAAPEQKDEIRRKFEDYKLHTQRYSFAVALALSLAASMVGVRAVAPLLAAPPQVSAKFFNMFDVVLTSLLLAGGCDGIHQVVTTITTALDTSKAKNKAEAPAPDKQNP